MVLLFALASVAQQMICYCFSINKEELLRQVFRPKSLILGLKNGMIFADI